MMTDSKFKIQEKGPTMPINHQEIIEDIEGQIRKCHGAWDGCVGEGGEVPFLLERVASRLDHG